MQHTSQPEQFHLVSNWDIATWLWRSFQQSLDWTMPNHEDWQTRSLPPFQTPDSDLIREPAPLRRAQSFGLPGLRQPVKSNLRVKTQRESLQISWGSSNPTTKTLLWREVHVRQYERTVGDNPSCSSGPPLR